MAAQQKDKRTLIFNATTLPARLVIMASTDSEMPCCTATAWGKLIETEISPNKGSDITMGGDLKVPAYITDSPSESKKGVVIFPDVYVIKLCKEKSFARTANKLWQY